MRKFDDESAKTVNKMIRDGDVLVRFHSAMCGHCLAMEPEWSKIEGEMPKAVDVVDVEQGGLGYIDEEYRRNIQGFPTIILFTDKGAKQAEYSGARMAKDIADWVKENTTTRKPMMGGMKRFVKSRRMNVKKSHKRSGKKTGRRDLTKSLRHRSKSSKAKRRVSKKRFHRKSRR